MLVLSANPAKNSIVQHYSASAMGAEMAISKNLSTPALFIQLETRQYQPTEFSTGPWIENTLHGSAMLGLIAHVAEQSPSDYPCQISRLTVDMMKAAPMATLDVEVIQRSAGRNLNTLDIFMRCSDKLYVQASVLRIRVNPLPIPEELRYQPEFKLPPPLAKPYFDEAEESSKFCEIIDLRFDDDIEPGILWLLFSAAVVQGFTLSGIERAAMAVDWTYSTFFIREGVRAMKQGKEYTPDFISINLDSTLNMSRIPVGDWIGIQSRPHYDAFGSGFAAGWVVDQKGLFGAAQETLLVRTIDKAPLNMRKEKDE